MSDTLRGDFFIHAVHVQWVIKNNYKSEKPKINRKNVEFTCISSCQHNWKYQKTFSLNYKCFLRSIFCLLNNIHMHIWQTLLDIFLKTSKKNHLETIWWLIANMWFWQVCEHEPANKLNNNYLFIFNIISYFKAHKCWEGLKNNNIKLLFLFRNMQYTEPLVSNEVQLSFITNRTEFNSLLHSTASGWQTAPSTAIAILISRDISREKSQGLLSDVTCIYNCHVTPTTWPPAQERSRRRLTV